MDYSENILTEVAKAFIHELGELARHAARGIAKGQAIKNSLVHINEKIIAAKKIGITNAIPLTEEKINALFAYIEPLTAFSFQNNDMRNVICKEIENYFARFAKIEEKYLAEVNFPEKRGKR